jgi:APA family basic amino acid/polyamine antiporter
MSTGQRCLSSRTRFAPGCFLCSRRKKVKLQIFSFIILLATFTTLVLYAFCAMSELMILITNRAMFNGRRLLGSSIIAIVAFACSVWTVIGSGAQMALYGFVLLLPGVPAYVWMRKKQADEGQKELATEEAMKLH